MAYVEKIWNETSNATNYANLHERTEYKVRRRASMNEAWEPQRGLRERCATSPILFNIYHACVLQLANTERRAQAEIHNMNIGIPWIWKPGYSFLPKSQTKAMHTFDNQRHDIAESLLDDDTTLLGTIDEIFIRRDSEVDIINLFEEICHPDKEDIYSLVKMRVSLSGCHSMVERRIIRKD